MKLKKSFFVFLLIVACLGAAGYYYFSEKTETLPYADFVTLIEKGDVSSVEISENKLTVTKKDGRKFTTPNPSSPDLKERLLMKGVEVKTEAAVDEIFSLVFYIVF